MFFTINVEGFLKTLMKTIGDANFDSIDGQIHEMVSGVVKVTDGARI